ncbi:ATP-binding protein [Streptomyces echinoruber]|uniref:sensor histidine kinase n=1 Tax=Streptomyces echinoruber TaxID=68898 RepID=UPI00360C0E3E
MPVPARPGQHRTAKASRPAPGVPLTVLVVTAAGAGAVAAKAPAEARPWVAAVASVAWLCVAVAVVTGFLAVRRARRAGTRRDDELATIKEQLKQYSAESAHLVNVTLPAVVQRLRDGASAEEALAGTAPLADAQLRRLVGLFATTVADAVRQGKLAEAEQRRLKGELEQGGRELEKLTRRTLPAAVDRLREGGSADTVLARLEWPRIELLRVPTELFVRELALSERRAAAAQAASAKALSRVQAKAVSMLADLREMQERHGEEVFGDLLKLDHSTSQLGLMTDRLALLMGGRSSRAWNKPIVMESILRGAVGRIAAYQRVRMHCSSRAAISGYAAEGVMHLLAELMDNAANFSPPIDEVHVYVEERTAGIVVTIEDSGLRMADAALRYAEKAVSGQVTDLASLQGTRLGLAVVGRLAAKYGISVNFRPSSRGGTGVVVLLPPQLLAQQRDPVPQERPRPAVAAPVHSRAGRAADEAAAPGRDAPPAQPAAEVPGPRSAGATPNGLPVRAPGAAMPEAERERLRRRTSGGGPAHKDGPPAAARDAGSRFGAFHRARRAGASGPETGPEAGAEGPEKPSGPPAAP